MKLFYFSTAIKLPTVCLKLNYGILDLANNLQVEKFPAMKASELTRLLCSKPLNYRIVRIRGSHKVLTSNKYPMVRISFHESVEITGSFIRNLLVKHIGLSEKEARSLI